MGTALFLFSTKEEKLAPIDPHNPEARWVPVEEVSALLTNEVDREFFNSIVPLPPLPSGEPATHS